MDDLYGTWYDASWTALALLNIGLIVFALRQLSSSARLRAATKVVLAFAAIFLPFLGPGAAIVVARRRATDRATPLART